MRPHSFHSRQCWQRLLLRLQQEPLLRRQPLRPSPEWRQLQQPHSARRRCPHSRWQGRARRFAATAVVQPLTVGEITANRENEELRYALLLRFGLSEAEAAGALSAARAIYEYEADPEIIARKAMAIAARICVYTNENLTIEEIS